MIDGPESDSLPHDTASNIVSCDLVYFEGEQWQAYIARPYLDRIWLYLISLDPLSKNRSLLVDPDALFSVQHEDWQTQGRVAECELCDQLFAGQPAWDRFGPDPRKHNVVGFVGEYVITEWLDDDLTLCQHPIHRSFLTSLPRGGGESF